MKQDISGKIAIHEKKSLISIVYTNPQFCWVIISKNALFTQTPKSKVRNRNDWKAEIAGFLTLCILAHLLFTPALVTGVTISIPTPFHTFMENGHEAISTIILLLLIQEGLMSVTSQSRCTEYWLFTLSSLPRKKRVVMWTDRLVMTTAVDWDVKIQNKKWE